MEIPRSSQRRFAMTPSVVNLGLAPPTLLLGYFSNVATCAALRLGEHLVVVVVLGEAQPEQSYQRARIFHAPTGLLFLMHLPVHIGPADRIASDNCASIGMIMRLRGFLL